jgi:hypothetical protein
MKKLLLAGTAIAGLVLIAPPANAEGLELGLGGFFRGYAAFADQDDDYVLTGNAADTRDFDLRRDVEVHFTGETTLDNGLTVGVHAELAQGENSATNSQDEVYAYFSGGWGRVNFGSEDGAAYLLQVAAPSADSNIDGLRPYIEAVNSFAVHGYDHADFSDSDRFTYLTPKWNGFQAGVSYAPEAGQNAVGNNLAGMATDTDDDEYEDLWEAAARWDGEFEGVSVSVGAGYSDSSLEATGGSYTDDLQSWNTGLDLGWGAFGLGVAYLNNEVGMDLTSIGGADDDVEVDTWVVGADYTWGAYTAGLSYFNRQAEQDGVVGETEEQRFTAGGTYAFGPGMSFRGSVSWFNADTTDLGETDEDALQVAIGTQIDF